MFQRAICDDCNASVMYSMLPYSWLNILTQTFCYIGSPHIWGLLKILDLMNGVMKLQKLSCNQCDRQCSRFLPPLKLLLLFQVLSLSYGLFNIWRLPCNKCHCELRVICFTSFSSRLFSIIIGCRLWTIVPGSVSLNAMGSMLTV